METRYGIPVSPGVAIGPALVLDTEGVRIPRRTVPPDHILSEIRRLQEAIVAAAEEARRRQKEVTARVGKDIGSIFAAHATLIEDQTLRYDIEMLVRSESYSAEYAVSRYMRTQIKKLDDSGGGERAERFKADFIDLEKQLLNQLLGDRREHLGDVTQPVIVLAHDLTPSETAQLPPQVVAFATESGGMTSHTAILAGSMEIPAVVGLGRLIADVSGGDLVIVDGHQGVVILDPDPATLARYEEVRRAERTAGLSRFDPYKNEEPLTKDGVRVALLGNIEFPNEAPHCLDRGADGVGLYRTEFLYVNKTHDPTEDEHYEAYRQVIAALGADKPVVIRTLDLGADKFSAASGALAEKNPFLGLRSVRLCLANQPLFKTQLRAILRASVLGDVRVMFPMVSTVMELRHCRSILREVQEDLEEAGVPFNPALPIGTMIEVPSAAVMADALAPLVNFFSIGTNDLVQYTLAADRNNEHVAGLYNPADPAVLRLIRTVVKAGADRGVEVNVCGEMSGEPLYTALLVGLGVRQMSATPRKIPELKRALRAVTVPDAERVADQALGMDSARDVTTMLREHMRRVLPDTAD